MSVDLVAAVVAIQRKFIIGETLRSAFDEALQLLLDLSGSEFGFVGEVLRSESGSPFLKSYAITNISWDQETRAFFEEFAPGGMEFHNLDTLFGEVIRTAAVVVANDPSADRRARGIPPGHPRLDSFLGLPLFGGGDELVGMAGVANRLGGYDEDTVDELRPLCDAIGVMIGAAQKERRQHNAEAALRESEQRFRALVEVSSQIVWTAEADGAVVVDSPSWRKFTGQTFEQWCGFGWLDALHPDDRDRCCKEWDRCRTSHSPVDLEYRLWHADSRQWRWMNDRGVCLRNSDGSPRMWVGMSVDIHERKTASEANARLAAIVDSTDYAILGLTLDGIITSCNAAAQRLFGYTSGELIGLFVRKLAPPERSDEVTRHLKQLQSSGVVQHLETARVRKDGSRVDVALTVSPVHDSLGQIVGASAIAQDVTEQKRMEAERERLLDEIVASREQLRTMSRRVIEAQEIERRNLALELHDEIGQVLTTVNLSLESLRPRIDPEYLGRLDESVRVVDRAIEQVRDLSHDLRPASLDVLGLEAALAAYAKRQCARAQIVVEVHSSLDGQRLAPTIETACFRIAQEALTNVIRHADAAHCWITLKLSDRDVLVAVRDDGIGFDSGDVRDRASRGNGFGLLGMRERVQLFGGTIEIASSLGRGTTVSARFPLLVGDDAARTEDQS